MPPVENTPNADQPMNGQSRGKLMGIIAVVGVIVLVGAGAAYYLWSNANSDVEEDNASSSSETEEESSTFSVVSLDELTDDQICELSFAQVVGYLDEASFGYSQEGSGSTNTYTVIYYGEGSDFNNPTCEFTTTFQFEEPDIGLFSEKSELAPNGWWFYVGADFENQELVVYGGDVTANDVEIEQLATFSLADSNETQLDFTYLTDESISREVLVILLNADSQCDADVCETESAGVYEFDLATQEIKNVFNLEPAEQGFGLSSFTSDDGSLSINLDERTLTYTLETGTVEEE